VGTNVEMDGGGTGGGWRRVRKSSRGVNIIKVCFVHVWGCHNEILFCTI
jgi:hypothetical protein